MDNTDMYLATQGVMSLKLVAFRPLMVVLIKAIPRHYTHGLNGTLGIFHFVQSVTRT
jgi:hypothetical protein